MLHNNPLFARLNFISRIEPVLEQIQRGNAGTPDAVPRRDAAALEARFDRDFGTVSSNPGGVYDTDRATS